MNFCIVWYLLLSLFFESITEFICIDQDAICNYIELIDVLVLLRFLLLVVVHFLELVVDCRFMWFFLVLKILYFVSYQNDFLIYWGGGLFLS